MANKSSKNNKTKSRKSANFNNYDNDDLSQNAAVNDLKGFKKRLINRALKEGFEIARIVNVKQIPVPKMQEGLTNFLSNNYHGEMVWLENRHEQRANPFELWPEVKSVLVLGQNYAPKFNPLDNLKHQNKGLISVYALGDDYHDVIKKKLRALARFIVDETKSDLKLFVDTAPVMEKPIAEAAGLGWQGKHTNLVSRDFGSWLLLGVIYLSVDLVSDINEKDHCGNCTRCLDICPTKAFPKPYQLDAKKCISYLTIEHKGAIPLEFRKAIGNRIYGCDDCLSICPWNKFAKDANEIKLKNRHDLNMRDLKDWLLLEETDFKEVFRKTPIKRIGYERFIRNVLIAAGNSNNRELKEHVGNFINHENPIIKETAIWAFSELNN